MIHISWGFIGCGEVTELKSGPAFNAVEGSHVEAVYSRNADKARDYAERHHIKKWYTDALQLINDSQINAIYIAKQVSPFTLRNHWRPATKTAHASTE